MRTLETHNALGQVDHVLGEGTRLLLHQVFHIDVAIVSLGELGQLRVILVEEPLGGAAVHRRVAVLQQARKARREVGDELFGYLPERALHFRWQLPVMMPL